MKPEGAEAAVPVHYPCADRIGLARLTTMAFGGADLRPLRDQLIAKLAGGTADAGEGLDLSLITQLLGDKQTGMAIQAEVLAFHRLFRSPCSAEQPKLRVLALAAAIDMGGNTPIEFLLEESGIELLTLYVIAGAELPAPLPDHDVAIVIASASDECRDALAIIDRAALRWPRPILNPPHLVRNLDRDMLYHLLDGIEGLEIPATACAPRALLSGLAQSNTELAEIAADLQFPIIIRPRGSHAGVGLAKRCARAGPDQMEGPEQRNPGIGRRSQRCVIFQQRLQRHCREAIPRFLAAGQRPRIAAQEWKILGHDRNRIVRRARLHRHAPAKRILGTKRGLRRLVPEPKIGTVLSCQEASENGETRPVQGP